MFAHIRRFTSLFILLLGVLIPLTSIAQVLPQRVSIEKHIKILKDKLKLNDEQIKKIKYVLEDQREELSIAMHDNRGDSQAMDEAVQEIRKNTDNKIKVILNEKQIEVYNKIIEEREHANKRQCIG